MRRRYSVEPSTSMGAFVFGFLEKGFGFVFGFVPDFANGPGTFGLGKGDEVTHPEELAACPFDGLFRIVDQVKAGNFVEQFEKFPGLGEVELNEGGKGSATPLGEGKQGRSFGIGEFAEGCVIGFLRGDALAFLVLEFDLGRNGVSLNAPGQGGGKRMRSLTGRTLEKEIDRMASLRSFPAGAPPIAKSGLPPPLPPSFPASSPRCLPAWCPASTASSEQMQTMAHFPLDSLASKTTEAARLLTWAARERRSLGERSGTTALMRRRSPACSASSMSLSASPACLLLEGFQLLVEFLGFGLHRVMRSVSSWGLQAS